ncbi:MAG: DUF305 domain-containing protein [Pseudomonadota bacterium]|nr:DUF305 domain-containing protein [Pseudomonadota bacterium]
MPRSQPNRFPSLVPAAALAAALAAASAAAEVPIVQPGAPGEPARALSAQEAIEVADTSYSRDDVRFMQDMIPHHAQAVQMAGLVAARTNNPDIIDIAGRINAAQADEIAFMQGWLEARGEQAPAPSHAEHTHASHEMMGMATPEQMAELEASGSTDFDRLFLQLMIPHHEGAVSMVDDLLDQPGAAYDPVLFEFTSDIVNDQTTEIEIMNGLLVGLSDDPRAGLAPGFRDAGEAIHNLRLLAALPKPAGFFDPENPAGLSPPRLEAIAQGEPSEAAVDVDDTASAAVDHHGGDHHGGGEATIEAAEAEADAEAEDDAEPYDRSPLLSFMNTDIAFAGNVMVVGNYHGYNIYRLDAAGLPDHVSSIVCPGGQGDVSIVGDLLIMSVEQTRGRLDCGLDGVGEDVSPARFRGIRIFDISDLERPMQVGAVQTCRGSHTHSVVSGPGEDGVIVVYNSGTATVRDGEELEGCFDESPGDQRTALFRIDVIEIPVNDPSAARIVDSPAVFADEETGALAGLWRGGDHGDDTQDTERTDQCHDITVFPAAGIAAGACSGNGIIFDISDPRAPTRIDEVVDEGFAYWHSATFNNDGTKVLFTDEWGGGSRPRCRAYDPLTWGADAIYDIVGGELVYRSHFKIPAPQVEEENCVAHNGSIVPIPGRDIFVQAWYQGGVSIIDFTDSAHPQEIAFFDRGPIDEEEMILGGYWSTYWYGGRIYGTEIARGIDVLELTPSDFVSANEIAAAALADQGSVFNPQQQFPVSWPAEPVIARAYIDQLVRAGTLTAESAGAMNAALDQVKAQLDLSRRDRRLARRVTAIAEDVGGESRAARGLADTLDALAARLRG